MPYQPIDAKRFTRKADTSKKQRQWKAVADSAIKSGASEGSAITQANGVIKRSSTRLKTRGRAQSRGRIRMGGR